ncbi:MAG: hypothetical protein M1829_000052 [Trizodia sp. TS-e1964]|nr:MAG: hypothetical protein M1829_000052 [Trizodia sp. TS-e1964]
MPFETSPLFTPQKPDGYIIDPLANLPSQGPVPSHHDKHFCHHTPNMLLTTTTTTRFVVLCTALLSLALASPHPTPQPAPSPAGASLYAAASAARDSILSFQGKLAPGNFYLVVRLSEPPASTASTTGLALVPVPMEPMPADAFAMLPTWVYTLQREQEPWSEPAVGEVAGRAVEVLGWTVGRVGFTVAMAQVAQGVFGDGDAGAMLVQVLGLGANWHAL